MKKILRISATHHKTGTVLISSINRELSKFYDLNFQKIKSAQDVMDTKETTTFLKLNNPNYTKISKILSKRPESRAIHIVRHPLSIIVSAYNYHLQCKEKWCFEVKEQYGGLGYQDFLKKLDKEDGLNEEIQRNPAKFKEIMYNWVYSNPTILELKFEDFYIDFKETLIKIFKHFLIPERDFPKLIKKCEKHNPTTKRKTTTHITNITGRLDLWKDYFSTNNYALFRQIYDLDLFTKLGYEIPTELL